MSRPTGKTERKTSGVAGMLLIVCVLIVGAIVLFWQARHIRSTPVQYIQNSDHTAVALEPEKLLEWYEILTTVDKDSYCHVDLIPECKAVRKVVEGIRTKSLVLNVVGFLSLIAAIWAAFGAWREWFLDSDGDPIPNVESLSSAESPLGTQTPISPSEKLGQQRNAQRVGPRNRNNIALYLALGSTFVLCVLIYYLFENRTAEDYLRNCRLRLRIVGNALQRDAKDNQGKLPPADKWCDVFIANLGSYAEWQWMFVCQADKSGMRCSYAFNAKLAGLDPAHLNPKTVILFESKGGWNWTGGPNELMNRHGKTYLAYLAGGSVEEISARDLPTLRWEP